MNDLHAFFSSRHFGESPGNIAVHPLQVGSRIQQVTAANNDWEAAEIVLIGCGERRGSAADKAWSSAPDAIREVLYQLYDWHPSVKVADLGNLQEGATLADTRAALRTVLQEVRNAGKIAVVLGGSQDLTLQQYEVFQKTNTLIDAAVIDGYIDLEDQEAVDDRGFLMPLLTDHPNYIRRFSQLGFQSYYTNPDMLETLDKLRFDCFRLGVVREDLEEMEPILRQCDLLSVDMNVLRRPEAPFLPQGSPNGLFGDELCQLIRYAGMSTALSSLGIYGYRPELDAERQGAQLIAQMLWYFIDGYFIRKNETDFNNKEGFNHYHVRLNEADTLFLKSKKTNRWWMQLPDGSFTPCSYSDYVKAGNNELPERWLREQERII